jgi:endoglucanase
MMFRHYRLQLICGFIAFLTVLTLVAMQVVHPSTAQAATSQFRGVNWADPRDNYANDPVVPSGLATSDSYATTYAKAKAIIRGFATNLSANTVRMPINPYTVNGSFWNSYTGAIDAATAQGFKVILSYWEGTGSNKDGLIDNTTSFWTMWQTVTNKYASNSLVYFEPMNEPYGYSQSAWANIAAQWISTYPSIPRNRIFVSGTGWNDNVTTVCADSRLNGTFLSLHVYGFDGSYTDIASWENNITSRIGSNCYSRTVVDEWGAPMTTGLNYDGSINGNQYIAFVQAMAIVTNQHSMGSVYWPGLRNGDNYSMETLNGSGTALSLTNTNASGVDQLKYSYGLTSGSAPTPTPAPGGGNFSPNPNSHYRIVNRNSGQVLDVSGASTANGGLIDQWPSNGGANQLWRFVAVNGGYKLVNVNSGLLLDDPSGSKTSGTRLDQWSDANGSKQWWNVVSDGNSYYSLVNQSSGLYADVSGASTANGAAVIQWPGPGGTNQQWQVVAA